MNLKHLQIFRDYGFADESYDMIVGMYNQAHRKYHTTKHLRNLLQQIEDLYCADESITEEEYETLVFAAYFHDCVYEILPNADNELQSEAMFRRFTSCLDPDAKKKISREMRERISTLIIDTAFRILPTDDLSREFWMMDNRILFSNFLEMLEWEKAIFREWQKFSLNDYKSARIKFLENEIKRQNKEHPETNRNIQNLKMLIDYVENFVPRVAVYSGSFDPFHIGHYNIVKKADAIFDKVIIVKGYNPEKKLDFEYKRENFPKAIQHFEIIPWPGMLHDLIKKLKEEDGLDPVLVRGLRNGKDLDYEVNQLRFQEEFYPDMRVIYIPCDKNVEHVSSSAIRSITKFDPEAAKKYIML